MIQKGIGEYLIKQYGNSFCHHENNIDNNKVAVLVETRDAFFLPLVIKNFCQLLGEGWNFHLFINNKVKNLITSELPYFHYRLTDLPIQRMTNQQYSYILRQKAFWEQIPEETILIFQTDCVLLRPIPSWAEEYDMIGAPCGLIHGNSRCTFNGGFSLRKRKAMIATGLDDVEKNKNETRPEDVFFTDELWKYGGFHLPDVKTAYQFATEDTSSTHPIGIHGTDKYYSDHECFIREI